MLRTEPGVAAYRARKLRRGKRPNGMRRHRHLVSRETMNIHNHRLPLLTAALHAALFTATVAYVYLSSAGQAALVWVLWAIADLPVSLLYFAAPWYSRLVRGVVAGHTLLEHVLYLPHVIHGLLGTAWWYIMPRFVTAALARRRDP